jgi:tetratricopeptide (TPR) repeat protein
MRKIHTFFPFCLIALMSLMPVHALAQYGAGGVHLPYESQKAWAGQRIGLTDIEVVYHRPAVKGRKIWGGLVPFDSGKPVPWRGGANENTTISFSSDVTIEGKPLAKGIYGLHFIPGENEWIVIFSKNSTSWGSFSYNESEDALRVTVKPKSAEFEEYLKYEFVSPKPSSVLLQLHWEKLAVGFTVDVDLDNTVLENIRKELRNTPGFSWVGYNSAAMFCIEHNFNYEEAMKWVKRSISSEERFENLETLSDLQKRTGDSIESEKTMKRALDKASAMQINSYGRQLLGQKRTADAMNIFQYNLKKNPNEWIVYAGMARGFEALGDMEKAIANMKTALDKAPESSKANIRSILATWQK